MSQKSTIHLPTEASAYSYVFGFVVSLILTLVAYFLTTLHLLSGTVLISAVLVLAILQTIIQLWYFLHVGREEKPRWNTIFLLNTLGIILLIVIASIWIMNSLHYRMMSPAEMEQQLLQDEGIKH